MEKNPARPTFILDQGQRVTRWSRQGQSLLGFEEGDVQGRHCYDLFRCWDWEGRAMGCRLCPPFTAMLEGRVGQRRLLLRRKDGRRASFLANLAPASLPSGAMVLLQPLAWHVLPALEAVAGAVAQSVSLDQTLDRVLEQTLALSGAETAEVFLAEGASGDMAMAGHRGLFSGAFTQLTRFKIGEGFPGLVATSSSPLVTSALGDDPRYLRSKVKDRGFQFYLCLPLLSQGGVVGCLNVASRYLPRDMAALLPILWPLGHMASAAVQMNQLRAQDMVAPWEFPGERGGSKSQDPALRNILQAMMSVEGADSGALSLWNMALQELQPKVALGAFQEGMCSARACPALEGGEAVFSSRSRLTSPSCRGGVRGLAQVICLPLLQGRQRVGLVSLGSEHRSSVPTRHLGLLSLMAARAAQAIFASQSYDTVEELPQPERTAAHVPTVFTGSPVALDSPLLDIRCFGRFLVFQRGKLLPLSAFPRRQALTALKILLTRRGRPVSQDYLIECLWPEAPPQAAKNRLQVVIHSLRRCLESEAGEGHPIAYILTEGSSYSFNTAAPHRLDVDEFLAGVRHGQRLEAQGERPQALEAYRRAAELYVGDYLEDEPYSDWCSEEREALREIYISLLKSLASLLRERGNMEGCIHYYRQALAADKMREEMHRELMRSLWQAGRRDEAVKQYFTCRQVLAQELGVSPLPETEELYQAILTSSAASAST